MAKKTWAEKLHVKHESKVEVVEKDFSWVKAGTKILISTPLIFKERVDVIPHGQFRSVPHIREELANEAGADMTCPMSAGIFMRIVCEAAWDEHLEGAPLDSITPFWRAVDANSNLGKKLRCGVDFIKAKQTEEGIQ
ncbi:MAG: hypothetical protein KDC26_01240 [Armatimonadetes bacterium]|nr:hypothetical protein [Armatimonadota bacterium]